MSEYVPTRRGEDTDLLCVEVSALGALPGTALPQEIMNGREVTPRQDYAQEEFLRSLLLKMEAYRPRQSSLPSMENRDFLAMRRAVVNWFTNVAISYDFANETVVAALSNFDRYVAVTLEPVTDHLVLQLAAYVALLVASKMSEVSPLRMKSLANLTGRMFTPVQVQKCELDMISKLQFRLAPPSPDEMLHSLVALIHDPRSTGVSMEEVEAASAGYLRKARERVCWFRNTPFTLAIAAFATAYNALGLRKLRRRLLHECDARSRMFIRRGVDLKGFTFCAAAMSGEERAAAAAAAAAAAVAARVGRGGVDSPVCNKPGSQGWGSPTGVAQGAELLQEAAFSTVSGLPLVEELSPTTVAPPKSFSPCPAPRAARVAEGRLQPAPQPESPEPPVYPYVHKRGLGQTSGSCFVPCARRRCIVRIGSVREDIGCCVVAEREPRLREAEFLPPHPQERCYTVQA